VHCTPLCPTLGRRSAAVLVVRRKLGLSAHQSPLRLKEQPAPDATAWSLGRADKQSAAVSSAQTKRAQL